jgi:hypothetical protein
MSLRAILSGAVGKAADLRTSKNGNSFATFSIRESFNGSSRWWQAITFNENAIEILKEMAVSEPIAVCGEITAEIYAPAGTESRINWRITVDGVLTARRKPKARQSRERAPSGSGREIAASSWAVPPDMGGERVDDCQF